MRTSEIIILKSWARSISSACWPEPTGRVSKPWLFKKESSRLRWPESSSTMRMRGVLEFDLRASAGMSLKVNQLPAKFQATTLIETANDHHPNHTRRGQNVLWKLPPGQCAGGGLE